MNRPGVPCLRPAAGSVLAEDLDHLPIADAQHRQRAARDAAHAGRAGGHAGQCDAVQVRLLAEQLLDGGQRYVALDEVVPMTAVWQLCVSPVTPYERLTAPRLSSTTEWTSMPAERM